VTRKVWNDIFRADSSEDHLWEVFHENSKTSRYGDFLPNEVVLARMEQLLESLSFDQYPEIALPRSFTSFTLSLEAALTARVSARSMRPCLLTLENIATLLFYACGVTRDNAGTPFPRPFRVVPSGGALYPLEIFFYSAHLSGAAPGLYHYNPTRHSLRLLHEGDLSPRLAEALVQQTVPYDASLMLFLTAMFERSTFKYGARGYRFILLEAGHVAQNINLVATALGLGCINLGGYFDRQVDEVLGLDGLNHSTIYMMAIGEKLDDPHETNGLV